MANNKIEDLHKQLPRVYNTRNNPIWAVLIDALGESDQNVADLVENVRKQFFIKTATRPYIDRLGSRENVQRPRFVGMDDPDFRKFIPIMSYQPKQVKLIFDKLLDLFFLKDATTSFIQTTSYEPFILENGWTLEYDVDQAQDERIEFSTDEFTNIAAATADEIVAAINRQSRYSYAIAYDDSLTKRTYIRIFTNTIGSKGSLTQTGGLANIGMRFNGFIDAAGTGSDTVWNVTKVGDTVTFTHASGGDPGLTNVQIGDIALINLPNNLGAFPVTAVDLGANSFSFDNMFATVGTETQTSDTDLKFMEAYTANVWQRARRAITWEVSPGEIVVELPPSPPVVKRERKGAAHINGTISLMTARDADDSLTVVNADDFPDSGKFAMEMEQRIMTELIDNDVTNHDFFTRLISDQPTYTYTGKTGNTLTGISPTLPELASLNKVAITGATRTLHNMTVITTANHNLTVGEYAIMEDTVTIMVASANGTWRVDQILSPTSFICRSPGDNGVATGGTTRIERIGLKVDSTKILLRTSTLQPDMPGPYMWDANAPYVLSSYTTNLTAYIQAGTTVRNIQVGLNEIPDEEGRLIFGFGTEREEGPVRYFFKPSDTAISIDPAYIFEYAHPVGDAVTMIRRRGGIQFGGLGTERAPYITDPAAAREVLQELMEEIKSVGIFLNFLVRYPVQYYSTIDVYKSGIDPDDTYWEASNPSS